jgi:DNA-binding NtrC family response regulator
MASGYPAGMPEVLLVEDDADVLEVLQQALTEAGYVVATASTRTEAARHLMTRRVDLLITDLVLEDGDGGMLFDVAERRGIPVVGITGYLTRQAQRVRQPPRLVLRKPFPAEHLTLAAQRLLARGAA